MKVYVDSRQTESIYLNMCAKVVLVMLKILLAALFSQSGVQSYIKLNIKPRLLDFWAEMA